MRDLGRQPAGAEIVFIVDALDSSILAEQRNQVAGFKACSGASTMQMNAQADAQRQRLELRARRLQIKTSNAGDQHRQSASANLPHRMSSNRTGAQIGATQKARPP